SYHTGPHKQCQSMSGGIMRNWREVSKSVLPFASLASLAMLSLAACAGDPSTSPAVESRSLSPPRSVVQPALVPSPIWGGTTTVDLIAGTHTVVGTVTAAMVGGKLEVSYALNAPWSMTESELDIETDAQRIPQTPHHLVIPGRFADHTRHHPAVTAFTYQQDITWQPGHTLYLPARPELAPPRTP